MDDVVRRIYRLRKVHEQMARLDLADAERGERTVQANLTEIGSRIAGARTPTEERSAQDDADASVYVLRLEMLRRGQERDLRDRRREVTRHENVVRLAARDTRVVERLSELRDERAAHELGVRTQRTLDEQGLSRWKRNAG